MVRSNVVLAAVAAVAGVQQAGAISAGCAAAMKTVFDNKDYSDLVEASKKMQGLVQIANSANGGGFVPSATDSGAAVKYTGGENFYAPYCEGGKTYKYPCDPTGELPVSSTSGNANCKAAAGAWDQKADPTKPRQCANGNTLNDDDVNGGCCDAESQAGPCITVSKEATSFAGKSVQHSQCVKRWFYPSMNAFHTACSVASQANGIPYWISASSTIKRVNTLGEEIVYKQDFVDTNFICIPTECSPDDKAELAKERATDCASKSVSSCMFQFRPMLPTQNYVNPEGNGYDEKFGYILCDNVEEGAITACGRDDEYVYTGSASAGAVVRATIGVTLVALANALALR
jgi:hypothetical protein